MTVALLPTTHLTAQTKHVMTLGREGNTTFTRNFNPFSPSPLWPTLFAMYDPMMVYDRATQQLVPRLATDYKGAADGLSLTFSTRDNVKWSDGQPFTAQDVIYTFGLVQKIYGKGTYDYLDSVTSPDGKTVLFKFNRIYSPGLYELAGQVIVPQHVWKDVADPTTFTNPNPVATGPFTEVANFQDQVYEVDKNPNYWEAGKPYIDGVRVPAYPGNDEVDLAVINGETDWADVFIPNIDQTFVSKDPSNRYYWVPSIWGTAHLYVNTTKKPFDDPNVRKAISMAINRPQIMKIAFYNVFGTPADGSGLAPRYQAWKNPDAVNSDWTTLNVDKANALLDAAGLKKGSDGIRTLPDGTPMRYQIIVGATSTDWVASSQTIAQDLKQVGMDVTVKGQDWGQVIDEMQKGQFDMAHAWSSEGATPYNFFRGVMSSLTVKPIGQAATENYQRYADPRADDLLKQFSSTFDLATQKDIINKLQQLYVEDAPAIPLFFGVEFGEFTTTRFTGFPSKDNAYADSNSRSPTASIVLTTIKPK
ncbi:MAG: ABC transporter substrate-binding protein [Aggregatilineales bacterium]